MVQRDCIAMNPYLMEWLGPVLVYGLIFIGIIFYKYRKSKDQSKVEEPDRTLSASRQKVIAEKGYDPYCISSVMKANGISYSPYKKVSRLQPKRSGGYTHGATSSYSGESSYVYRGEDDPVHRPHHYEKDEYGRRYRVYDDEEYE